MQVLNKTHYHSFMTRLYNDVPETTSFSAESSKRTSYQQRLYFEYLYTQKVKGVAYFITFTYNNNAVPTWNGHNVFNYDHVRLITNGKISKVLNRTYNASMKYFCACETGDGKGMRGLGNNPHYHFIFFIQPLNSNFQKPTPTQFLKLVKSVWQFKTIKHPIYGTNIQRLCDWKEARFGHVEPGNNQGVINSADAFGYVSKYCTKPSTWLDVERDVLAYYTRIISEEGAFSTNCIFNYYEQLKDSGYYNSVYSPRAAFLEDSGLLDYAKYRRSQKGHAQDYKQYMLTYRSDLCESFTMQLIHYFHTTYKELAIKTCVRRWKNRFGLKTRMSNGVGLYGLEFVKNKESNPTISYITSKDCQNKPLCLYLYRKLYMDIAKCPVTGNPLYVLNDLGRTLKLNQLPAQLQNSQDIVHQAMLHFADSKVKNPFVFRTYYSHISVPRETMPGNTTFAYAVYSHVYKYRHYMDDLETNIRPDMELPDILKDYDKFLLNTYWSLDYDDISLKQRIYSNRDHLIAYTSHPAFAPYSRFFGYLDQLTEAYRNYISDSRKADFERKAEERAKLNRYKFNHL